MPHTIKNCFYKNLTFEKLLRAHYRAKKLKTAKPEVIQFEMHLENNITNLLHQLQNGTYHIALFMWLSPNSE